MLAASVKLHGPGFMGQASVQGKDGTDRQTDRRTESHQTVASGFSAKRTIFWQ